MLHASQLIGRLVLAALALAGASCAGTPSERAGYEAFLNKIAQDCKPLIIGTENFGQALVFNGLGVDPDHYANFLSKTSGLYYGGIPPDVYRNSLTGFLGTGTYNKPSFDCIIAHLPKQ
jgi:hypothetical protein